MSSTWDNALQYYRSRQFEVFTRDDLVHISLETLLKDLPASTATIRFLQRLSQPRVSVWDTFLAGVQSVHPDLQEHEIFAPLRQFLQQATNVAVLYGNRVPWKPPDQWSYLVEFIELPDTNTKHYLVAHAPATVEHIQQAERVLGRKLSPQYTHFLSLSNGLGIDVNAIYCIYGVGSARATWEKVVDFHTVPFYSPEFREISSAWLQWQGVLSYGRQRDHQTGINTFLSNEHLLPFGYTFDMWCFDYSQHNSQGEYGISLWNHELREATYEYPDFATWFTETVREESS